VNAPVAPSLVERLTAALPEGRLSVDAARRALFGHDVMTAGATPAVVVRPETVEELQAAVAAAHAARAPVTVRGGGASYTQGYAPRDEGGLALDMTGLNRIVEIDATARTCTVETGVTWAQLDAALAPLGLRAPFWGPYSGLVATIAGSLSQHAVSMGTGLFETSATAPISLDVVDGRGRLIRTAKDGAFLRAHGPDMTGLFLGDCGALGVKARATLRLMRRPTHVAACSFAFRDFAALVAAGHEVAGRSLASEMLGLDPEIQKGFLGQLTPKKFAATAQAIWSTAPGPIEAAAALLRAATAVRDFLGEPNYAFHVTVEGWSKAEVAAKVASVRAIAKDHGVEVANAAPLALRGAPFAPLAPVLAPDGFRWLPTHGVFSWAKLADWHAAFESFVAERRAELDARRIRITRMLMPIGTTAFLYEPTMYWPDGRTIVQQALAPPEHYAATPVLADDPETRAFVFATRKALTGLMQTHGAQHFQLGKWYPYADTLPDGGRALLLALKSELDPAGILNPGALELG
jgi:FAD/FMN-containing dehydrogenase